MLDFLDLPEAHQLRERDLESAILDQLQSFLLELGKGFAFVGRQWRIAFEDVVLGPFEMRVDDLRAGADGRAPKTITVNDCGRVRVCRRLPARAPATARAGQALVGRYRCDDLDADATIAFEGKELALRLQGSYGMRHIVLEAVAEHCFRMTWRDPLDPTTSALIPTVEQGVVTGFRCNSLRTRHLRFVRMHEKASA